MFRLRVVSPIRPMPSPGRVPRRGRPEQIGHFAHLSHLGTDVTSLTKGPTLRQHLNL